MGDNLWEEAVKVPEAAVFVDQGLGNNALLCANPATGQIRRFVNIYVNGDDVRFLDGLGTALKDGDEVSIVPAVAGGA